MMRGPCKKTCQPGTGRPGVLAAILIGLAFVLLHGLALKAVLVLFAGLLAKTAVALKLDR